MNAQYDEALVRVEGILSHDPDHPEALFLMAQILGEGYTDREGAKEYLLKAAKAEPDTKAPIHRWARTLYREISRR